MVIASVRLLGLLFGFRPTGPSQRADAAKSAQNDPGTLRHPRTNLEEIADWLTKVILDAGLVGLTTLVRKLPDFGKFIASGVEPVPLVGSTDPLSPCSQKAAQALQTNTPIALAVGIFFLASGVLYGYLWSRWEFVISTESGNYASKSETGDEAAGAPVFQPNDKGMQVL